MVKIALCGRMRSGKDSVADILEEQDFFRYKFSQGIWETIELLFGQNEENTLFKPRKLLQELGQKIREVDPDVWVNYTLNEIKSDEIMYRDSDSELDVVITDLRQPNEYARLREEGYIIVRVTASEHARMQRARAKGDIFTEKETQHETESHVDSFEVDYEITNDGTFEDLRIKVEQMLESLGVED